MMICVVIYFNCRPKELPFDSKAQHVKYELELVGLFASCYSSVLSHVIKSPPYANNFPNVK